MQIVPHVLLRPVSERFLPFEEIHHALFCNTRCLGKSTTSYERCPKRRVTTLISRSTQARSRTGIEVAALDQVAGSIRPITKIVKVGFPNGLPRSAELIEAVEGCVPMSVLESDYAYALQGITRSRRMRPVPK